MINRIHIICHPQSGGQQGEKVWQEVTELLDSFHVSYLTYFTDTYISADLLTQQIIDRQHGLRDINLMVIGGDSTLHDVVNTVIKNQLSIPIAYISAGSGQDFYKQWFDHTDLREMVEAIVYQLRIEHLPVTCYYNHINQDEGVIINSLGIGFDAVVNDKRNQIVTHSFLNKPIFRSLIYKIAMVMSIPEIPYFDVELEVDEKSYWFSDISLISIMSHPYVGGGLSLYDQLSLNADEVEVVLFHDIHQKAIFDVFLHLLDNHKQHKSEYITYLNGKKVRCVIHERIKTQIDGKNLTETLSDLSFEKSTYPFYLPQKRNNASSR